MRRFAVFASTLVIATAALGCGPDLGKPPAVCSTQAVGAMESPLMEPGGDCNGCHTSSDGPSFAVAGTVMSALHDDNNCAGVQDIVVAVTGADGMRVEMTTNASGNFALERWPGTALFPYTAEVSRGGTVVPMLTPRAKGEGSCGSCHTAAGANAAPGRIVAP